MTTKVAPQLIDQTNGIGYTTGVGGTATQETSKSTAVTLNALCGRITLHNQSLAAGAAETFTLNNSLAGDHDVLVLTTKEYGGSNANHTFTPMTRNGGGGFFITVRNVSGSPVAEAVQLNFVVIKGVVA
jgi:hypothetical protein